MSAAIPPLGAVAIPAYTAYNYSKLGLGLYKAYREVASGNPDLRSAKDAVGSLTSLVAERPSNASAAAIVKRATQEGLFQEMAKKTGVREAVYAEMTRGSISSASSTAAGEFARFAIGKVIGA